MRQTVTESNPLVLFDGVCNLCQRSVQFIIRNDRQRVFRFAALQSDVGKRLVMQYRLSPNVNSVVLVDGGKAYTHSSAALRIARRLDGGWPLLYGFIIVPSFLRDSVYNLIARNRYRLFGKQESCWVPTPGLKALFLD